MKKFIEIIILALFLSTFGMIGCEGDSTTDEDNTVHIPSEVQLTFVHLTDLHIDGTENHTRFFEQTINEINDLNPDFVVITGDLVDGAEKRSVDEANIFYQTLSEQLKKLTVPVYMGLGNHDIVGIVSEEADSSNADYGKGMFQRYFGQTYYSFDIENWHCIVLDPHDMVDGRLVYRLPEDQLQWLKDDLKENDGRPFLVFFHEPTIEWQNESEVLKVLKDARAMFAGHWHFNLDLIRGDILQQVTGALCGEWWYGPNLDGSPRGYRIVRLQADQISTSFKGVGYKIEPFQELRGSDRIGEPVTVETLMAGFEEYSGSFVIVEGKAVFVLIGPPILPEGIGGILVQDSTGTVPVLIQTGIGDPLSLDSGDEVNITGVPLQYSLQFAGGSGYKHLIEYLPSAVESGLIASGVMNSDSIRFIRLVSSEDTDILQE